MSQAVVGALRVVLGMESAQFQSQMAKSQAELDNLRQTAATTSRSVSQLGEAAEGQGAHGMKMMAFQLNQVVQQGQATGNYIQALAIQIPDMAAGFGFLGAMIGGVAAVALPSLVNWLGATDNAAKQASDSVDALKTIMGQLRSASDAAATPLVDLREQYGLNAEDVQRLREMAREVARLQAERAFGTAARDMAGTMSDRLGAFTGADLQALAERLRTVQAEAAALREAFALAEQNAAAFTAAEMQSLTERSVANGLALDTLFEYRVGLQGLADQFAVSEAAAAQLAIQVAAVREADNTEERLSAAQGLAQAIFDSTDGLRNASDETLELYNSLLAAVQAGYDLEALDIASGIGAGADEAARLADNLERGNVAIRNRALAAIERAEKAQKSHDDFIIGIADTAITRSEKNAAAAPSGGGGGGGRGGRAPVDRRQTELEREAARVYEATRTEAEKYAAELAKLNELKASGLITTETFDRAVDALGDKMGAVGDELSQVQGHFRTFFHDIVTGAASGENALRGLLNSLASFAINSAFDAGWSALSSIGGLSGLFGGALPKFAHGGSFEVGGFGGVDSQIVAFRASPDERVTITRPGDDILGEGGGMGGTLRIEVQSSEDLVTKAEMAGARAAGRVVVAQSRAAREAQRRG